MPIIEMLHPNPSAEGTFKFTPKPGGVYRVDGDITSNGAKVWLQDTDTEEIVQQFESH